MPNFVVEFTEVFERNFQKVFEAEDAKAAKEIAKNIIFTSEDIAYEEPSSLKVNEPIKVIELKGDQ